MLTPELNDQFYVRIRGQIQGPFTPKKLKILAKRGRFSRAAEVSTDQVTWFRASEFPELFPAPKPSGDRKTRRPTVSPAQLVVEPNVAVTPVADDQTDATYAPRSGQPEIDPAGAAPEQLWHYTQNGQAHGPVQFSEIQSLAQTGQLTADTLVWTDSLEDWMPASTVVGIFADELLPEEVPQFGDFGAFDPSVGPRDGGPIAQSNRTAPMAVASLILGLICVLTPVGGVVAAVFGNLAVMWAILVVTLLFAILGAVFGHASLKAIRQSNGVLEGRGMSLTGLILSYIVLIILTVLGIVVTLLAAFGAGLALKSAS